MFSLSHTREAAALVIWNSQENLPTTVSELSFSLTHPPQCAVSF